MCSKILKASEPTECERCGRDIAMHQQIIFDNEGRIACLICKDDKHITEEEDE